MKKIVFIFLRIILFPFYFIWRTAKSKKRLLLKILLIIPQVIFVIPIWLIILLLLYFWVFAGLLPTSPFQVTGASMMPTLKNGEFIYSKQYPGGMFFKGQIRRGDIITFSNRQTEKIKGQKGVVFVKRVIALAGDSFEIREGFVYINGKLLDEPYILKPRSTYPGEKINQCQNIKIPENKALVLGDNRKASEDSRGFGLISLSDIQSYIPLVEQGNFKAKWRDSSHDKEAVSKSSFVSDKYIQFVNKKREERGLEPLRLNEKLSKSAKLRAEAMLKFNDLSWTATKSGYPMWKSMSDAGYSNVTYGEYPLLGYFNADELIALETERPNILDFFMKKDYQDIGISTFVGNLDGCPSEIILQQVAGYVPPNYKQSDIESWETTLSQLKNIQRGWQNLKNNNMYQKYKSDIDRINEIISIRITNIENIVSRMKSNQWLASGQTSQDKSLFEEQEALARKLNSSR